MQSCLSYFFFVDFFRAVTEYLYRIGANNFIPVLVEENCKLNGWLGIGLGYCFIVERLLSMAFFPQLERNRLLEMHYII